MKTIIHTIILLLLLCSTLNVLADDKKGYYNAFELAKTLSALEDGVTMDSLIKKPELKKEYELLLGRVLFYANLQDSTGSLIPILLSKTENKYTQLYDVVKKLFSALNPVERFFSIDTILPKQYDIVKNVRSNIVRSYKNRYEEHRTHIKQLNDSIKSKPDTSQLCAEVFRLSADSTQRDKIDSIEKIVLSIKEDYALIDDDEKRMNAIHDSATHFFNEHFLDVSEFLKEINNTKNTMATELSLMRTQDYAMNAVANHNIQVAYNYEIAAAQSTMPRIPSQSEVIDAVAIYIANRMKQEAVMWFFGQLKQNAARYDLLATFFPNTLRLLASNEVYDIPNLGIQWRYALAKDFVQLPPNVLRSKWLQERFPEMEKYTSYIDGTCSIAEGIMNKMSYWDIVEKQYMEHNGRSTNIQKIEFEDIITLLYAVNTELSVADTVNKQYRLLRYQEYRTLTAREMEIMLSLIDMKYNGAFRKFFKGMEKKLTLADTVKPEDIRLLLGKIENTVSEIEATRKDLIEEIKKTKENKNGGFAEITYSSLNVWNSVNKLLAVFDSAATPRPIFSGALGKSQLALHYTGQVFEIYNQVSKKNYAGAVQNTLTLIDSLFYGGATESMYSIDISDREAVRKKYHTSLLFKNIILKIDGGINAEELGALQRTYGFNFEPPATLRFNKTSIMAAIVFEKDRYSAQLVRKLAGFLNDVSLTTNSKELAKAVESYAMPVGSYKRKRNNWFSFDLNAFGGGYIGWEYIKGNKKADLIYGFSAPIGLSFSKTIGNKHIGIVKEDYMLNPHQLKINRKKIRYRTESTFTATLSIVDMGAVVSYRLQYTDEVQPQDAKWEQLISPGFHLGYGIPGTPLVLQGGVQYTPLLRKLSDDPMQQYNAFRIYAGLFFDLPLINLWEKKTSF